MAYIISYLIGSISPGYIFGKIIKGKDIRKYGNKNTGATNTYYTVGPVYGIIAGVFDFIKAPLAYYVGLEYFGLSFESAIIAGLLAVIGHIFPFYLKFKGGRGVASLYGLSLTTLLFNTSVYELILISSSVVYSIIISQSISFEAPLRKILKLGALVFPIGLLFFPKEIILKSLLILFITFFIFDILRLWVPHLNEKYLGFSIFSKSKENRGLSGATFLLAGIFGTIFLFPDDIAILALTIFMIADVLAPIGQSFIPIKLLKEKTVGGFIIIFATGITTGLFLDVLTPLSFALSTILMAGLYSAVVDEFSFMLDDNLLVPIVTAFLLTFV